MHQSPSDPSKRSATSEVFQKALEGCLYRRRSDQATFASTKGNEWSYHNHIVQGGFLRYIRRPILPKEASLYRLVLVAGKAKGRLTEMILNEHSEVTATKLSESEAPQGACYVVNVSGRCSDGNEERWQLALATSQLQSDWVEALTQAQVSIKSLQESGEYENLSCLASKMYSSISVRNRMQGFKLHRGVFLGTEAVKWIMSELNCCHSQAVNVGNQLLNTAFFHHVGKEHIFCDSKLYYRFERALDERLINGYGGYNRGMTVTPVKTDEEVGMLRVKLASMEDKFLKMSADMKDLKHNYRMQEYTLIALQLLCLGESASAYIILCFAIASVSLWTYIPPLLVISFQICLLAFYLSYLRISQLSPKGEVVDGVDTAVGAHDDEVENEADGNIVDDDFSTDLELMLEEEEFNDEDLDYDEALVSTPIGIGRASRERVESFEVTSPNVSPTSAPTGQGRHRVKSMIPPVNTWPNRPILVRRSPSMLMTAIDENSEEGRELLAPLRLHADMGHIEFPIESDFFIGKIVMIVQDLPNSPMNYFRQHKRKFRSILQGRFKRALPFSSVYSGQVFDEPIESLPAKLLVRTVLRLISKIQPGFKVSMKGDKPYFLSPLVSSAQAIYVSRVGNEPELNITQDLEEDLSLLGKKYVGMSSKRRKAHFSRRRNLVKLFYDPNLTYTFDFFQHILNLATFQADIGVIKYDLFKFLGDRPIQVMAVVWDPVGSAEEDEDEGKVQSSRSPPAVWPYLYNLEILHERSVEHTVKTDRSSVAPTSPTKKGVSATILSFFRGNR